MNDKVKWSEPWDVNAYVNGKKVVKRLLVMALWLNTTLDDVKKQLRAHFPNVVFKTENIKPPRKTITELDVHLWDIYIMTSANHKYKFDEFKELLFKIGTSEYVKHNSFVSGWYEPEHDPDLGYPAREHIQGAKVMPFPDASFIKKA